MADTVYRPSHPGQTDDLWQRYRKARAFVAELAGKQCEYPSVCGMEPWDTCPSCRAAYRRGAEEVAQEVDEWAQKYPELRHAIPSLAAAIRRRGETSNG